MGQHAEDGRRRHELAQRRNHRGVPTPLGHRPEDASGHLPVGRGLVGDLQEPVPGRLDGGSGLDQGRHHEPAKLLDEQVGPRSDLLEAPQGGQRPRLAGRIDLGDGERFVAPWARPEVVLGVASARLQGERGEQLQLLELVVRRRARPLLHPRSDVPPAVVRCRLIIQAGGTGEVLPPSRSGLPRPARPSTLPPPVRRGTDIAEAAAVLAGGGLVAFPTETVYGLGADATRPKRSRGSSRSRAGRARTR